MDAFSRRAPRRGLRPTCCMIAVLALWLAGPATAQPVDSDLAIPANGGGCYPTGLHPALFDMLTLVDPEWAPIVDGQTVDSEPVLVHGTVEGMHGDLGGDFPATHVRADVNYFVLLDPADAGRLATGNDDGLLAFEWEAGALPAWAWAGDGDRVVGLGRWIFDCGHTGAASGTCSATPGQACVLDSDCRPPICPTCGSGETCQGAHFGYSSELHPPYATAAIRSGRGTVLLEHGRRAVPATRVDIYVSADGGGAGDRCILTHQLDPNSLFATQCFPLSQPVAALNSRDFEFDVPLPPAPVHGRWWVRHHRLLVRRLLRPAPGGVAARLTIERHLDDEAPHLHVRVHLAPDPRHPDAPLPTGFAGTLWAGWPDVPAHLTHVRVHLKAIEIRNALQLSQPIAPAACVPSGASCSTDAECGAGGQCLGVGPVKAWHLQAAVNGEWQELQGLDDVSTGDVVPQDVVFDQYLPPDGVLRLQVDGAARECVTSMYGKSLGDDLLELGLSHGIDCLNSTEHSPGTVDVTYPGPDFGAGGHGAAYVTPSQGGVGGVCSSSTDQACLVDADCPTGETCNVRGGAMAVRYWIERVHP
jgi:hypothetical protein